MQQLNDSMVVLTNQEYTHLQTQHAYYYAINKDVEGRVKEGFNAGYKIGGFNGVIIGILVYALAVSVYRWYQSRKKRVQPINHKRIPKEMIQPTGGTTIDNEVEVK